METLNMLGNNNWSKDHGLSKAINTATGDSSRGQYYQKEKAYMPLFDFLVYVDKPIIPVVLDYFDLPADTVEFARWVFNKVGYMDAPKRVKEPMTIMPYSDLYKIFPQRESLPPGNVKVYKNGRILDGDGNELQPKR